MRASFYQRRRVPNVHMLKRAEGALTVDEPTDKDLLDDGLSDSSSDDDKFSDEESSDDEGESSDEEDDDEDEEEGDEKDDEKDEEKSGPGSPRPTDSASLPSSAGPGPTSTSISSSSNTAVVPTTTLLTATRQPVITSINYASSTSSPLASFSGSPTSSTIPTSELLQSTSSGALLDSPTGIPGLNNAVDLPNSTDSGSGSNSNHRAGQIAGGTIGGITFVGLLLALIWMWRRRRSQNSTNRLSWTSETPPSGEQQPGFNRTPSSIMNQLMTAAYAAEDGRDFRNSGHPGFDSYYTHEEKQDEIEPVHINQSTERLTVPPAAQMRPPSIAARTETTTRTESTWKTWGVLAGSSRPPPGPRTWWVDRYMRG